MSETATILISGSIGIALGALVIVGITALASRFTRDTRESAFHRNIFLSLCGCLAVTLGALGIAFSL